MSRPRHWLSALLRFPVGLPSRRTRLGAFLLLLCSQALVAQIPANTPLQTPAGLSKIQHFVFILKENRSFDHYFGAFPGADGATTATISTGQVIPLGPAPDQLPRD